MKAADPVTDLERVFLKEKLLRFAVGSRATGYSSIWSAWSYQNDFYLGVCATLGDMKVSLHESLICNYGMTERSATLLDPSGQRDRAIVKWRRRPAPSKRAHLVASICFPTACLRLPIPEQSTRKPVRLFKAAPAGRARQVDILFSREDETALEMAFRQDVGDPFCHWGQPNGDTVWLLTREAEFDAPVIPEASEISRRMRVLDPRAVPGPGEQLDNLNAVLWDTPRDGDPPQLIEIGGISIRHEG
jgi:hypothetical protein